MKNQMSEFKSYSKSNRTILPVISVIIACIFAVSAQAGNIKSDPITVSLGISNATCTVTNQASAIQLPSSSSASQLSKNYVNQHFDIHAKDMTINAYTAVAYNQYATIQCDVANTPIFNFIVKPVDATDHVPGLVVASLLKDGGAGYAAGGDLYLRYEQVDLNGDYSASFSYSDSSGNPLAYTVPFNTQNIPNGEAHVTWRPVIGYINGTTLMGTPTSGNFAAQADIVVNY